MAISPDFRTYPQASAATTAAVLDAGLRAYMLRVYNWMSSGLVLTGVVAYAIAYYPPLHQLFYRDAVTQFGTVVHNQPTFLAIASIFAPLAFVLVLSMGVNRLSKTAAQALYWVFCAAMGASLTNIFMVYTGESVVRVFFITAATFAGMSIFGYTTKADLSRFGSFLFMGLIGIIIAGLVNMFMHSSALQFAISVIGVLVFTGLTAVEPLLELHQPVHAAAAASGQPQQQLTDDNRLGGSPPGDGRARSEALRALFCCTVALRQDKVISAARYDDPSVISGRWYVTLTGPDRTDHPSGRTRCRYAWKALRRTSPLSGTGAHAAPGTGRYPRKRVLRECQERSPCACAVPSRSQPRQTALLCRRPARGRAPADARPGHGEGPSGTTPVRQLAAGRAAAEPVSRR